MATRAFITPKARQRFQNLARLPDVLREATIAALRQSGNIIVEEAQRILADQGKIVTGELLTSFRINVNTRGRLGPILTVSNTAQGASAVELGRRPGSRPPPVEALRVWAEISGFPSDDESLYLLGQKIARDGIEGSFFLTQAGRIAGPQVSARVAEEVRAATSRLSAQVAPRRVR